MTRKTVSSLCGAIVLGMTVIASQASESVDGDWAGDLVLQGTAQFAMLHISGSGPSYEGSLELPFMGEKATLAGFKRDDRSLMFTASNSTYSLHFVGEVKGGMFEGSVQEGPTNVSGDRFRFAHLARIDFSKYTGGYDLGGGRVISISPIPEQDMGAVTASVVQYTDTGTGRWGTLFPISPTRFISGGPAARVFPAEIDVVVLHKSTGTDHWVDMARNESAHRTCVQSERVSGGRNPIHERWRLPCGHFGRPRRLAAILP